MKKQEKIKFFIYGFFASLLFFVLISATIQSNENEVGRFQVVTTSGEGFSVYAVILDTKTGNFIEGESSGKPFDKKKNIRKGNFQEIFNDADIEK